MGKQPDSDTAAAAATAAGSASRCTQGSRIIVVIAGTHPTPTATAEDEDEFATILVKAMQAASAHATTATQKAEECLLHKELLGVPTNTHHVQIISKFSDVSLFRQQWRAVR